MPLRAPYINRFIFGFHRRGWGPEWAPDSSSSLLLSCAALLPPGSSSERTWIYAITLLGPGRAATLVRIGCEGGIIPVLGVGCCPKTARPSPFPIRVTLI